MTIDVDTLVDDADAEKMKSFDWGIVSASDREMGLEIFLSDPSLFVKDNGEQFLVMKA